MAKSWDDISPRTGGDRDKFQLESFFKIVEKKQIDNKGAREPKYATFRFHGGVVSFEQAWIPLYKDGRPVLGKQTGKPVQIPKIIPTYDSDSEGYSPNVADPYLSLIARMNETLDKEDRVRIQRTYLTNAIWRLRQKGRPRDIVHPTAEELQSGFITPESETWTANYVFPMSPSLAERVKNLKSLNTYMIQGRETAYSVTHPQAGCDVGIKYDSTLAAAMMWDAQKGNRAQLSKEEVAMLQWDLDVIPRYVAEIDMDAAKSDADRFAQGFFHNERRGGSGRSVGRTLASDDLPADLGAGPAPSRGRGRGAPPQQAASDFDGGYDDGYGGGAGFAGGQDFGNDAGFGDTSDLDGGFDAAPPSVQTRRPAGGGRGAAPPSDFADNGFGADDGGFGAADDGFGGAPDGGFGDDPGFGGTDDFADAGGQDFGNDGFEAPAAPAERMPARRAAPAAQNRGRQAPLDVDAGDLGDLGGLDEDGDAGFGSNDFGGDDAQAPVRRGPGPAPAQARGPAQQQRGPTPGGGRPQNPNGQQQQQRPGAGAQQRAPAPAQQRAPQNGQQQRAAAPAPGRGPVRQGAPAGGAYGYGGGYGNAPQAPRGPSQQFRPSQPTTRGPNPRDPRYRG